MTAREQDMFVAWVMDRLAPIVDPIDFECTYDAVVQCYEDQFSMQDALRYCRYLEHVNPDLPERYACAQMHKIGMLYPRYRLKVKTLSNGNSYVT